MVLDCEAVGKAEDDVVERLNQCLDDDSKASAGDVVECNVIECDVVSKAVCIVLNHVWQTDMGLQRGRSIYHLWQCLACLHKNGCCPGQWPQVNNPLSREQPSKSQYGGQINSKCLLF